MCLKQKNQQIQRQKLLKGKYEPHISVRRKNMKETGQAKYEKRENNWRSIRAVIHIICICINKSVCCHRDTFISMLPVRGKNRRDLGQ